MPTANIVDHIGSKVTVFTKDGNVAENRKLHTVDEFGIVISNQHGKRTFIPWVQVKYVDYADEPNVPLWNDPLKLHAAYISKCTTKELIDELVLRDGVTSHVVPSNEESELIFHKDRKEESFWLAIERYSTIKEG
ncbi:hypothetical protein BK129_14795 [Paenibacillus amylolyticus]|uniref:hypothetical protein n=1 Tax=Paenibacillus amylolyticus TaxID=1451 RepID=UPI00096D1BE5|nr:hypothetical protein [Paenibacillus amylolyticus]OMF05252.1 hypothetical protein BK129_14795 [Paenibacillus amylolyticus]